MNMQTQEYSANPLTSIVLSASLMLVGLGFGKTRAGDWPQILGPSRNGLAQNEKLADNWNSKRPTKRWQVEIGEGYAGPAVVGDDVLAFFRREDSEILTCFSRNRGRSIWSTSWKASYAGGIDADHGPRCVPLVHEGRIFVFGAAGDLHCASLDGGKKIWTRQLGRDYRAQDGYFGFGSGPIVVGKTVMVNVGGTRSSSIVGLDVETGETRWTQFKDAASYSAPAYWGSNALFITRLHLLGLNPKDGSVIFQMPFGARGPTVNAATPVFVTKDQVFVTASYRIGGKLVSLAKPGSPDVIWKSDNVLSSQFPTPVVHNGHLFGVHGREDGPKAALRCVDAATGKVAWEKKSVGMAHLIVADDKLLMLKTDGELVLLGLSTTQYEEKGRVTVSDSTARPVPALSNGTLFLRNSDELLSAWDLP